MDMHIAQDLPLTGIDVYSLPPAEGEAVLRRQLAAAYRLVDLFRLDRAHLRPSHRARAGRAGRTS